MNRTDLNLSRQNNNLTNVLATNSLNDFYRFDKDKDGNTKLHIAARTGNVSDMQLILSNRLIDLNVKNNNDKTPLHLASRNGNTECVKLLLTHQDINVNAQDKWGNTSLLYACGYGYTDCVKTLLLHTDINITIYNNDGVTAFDRALMYNHLDCFKELVNHCYSKDNKDSYPLHRAIIEGNIHKITTELTKPDALNQRDMNGWTPLYLAVSLGNIELTLLLLSQQGINVNEPNSDNRTPLHVAAMLKDDALLQLLLTKNDIDIKPKR